MGPQILKVKSCKVSIDFLCLASMYVFIFISQVVYIYLSLYCLSSSRGVRLSSPRGLAIKSIPVSHFHIYKHTERLVLSSVEVSLLFTLLTIKDLEPCRR